MISTTIFHLITTCFLLSPTTAANITSKRRVQITVNSLHYLFNACNFNKFNPFVLPFDKYGPSLFAGGKH